MVLVLVTVLAGVAIGYARGGSLANLNYVRLRWGWLIAVAVGAQIVVSLLSNLGGPAETLAFPLLLSSHAALFAFVWANRRLAGMLLVFVGFALNALVIAANGAMPVSRRALATVAGEPDLVIPPGKHRLLEEGDALVFLADVLPIPPLRTVVSVGDIILAVGVAFLVVALMTRPPQRRPLAQPPARADEP